MNIKYLAILQLGVLEKTHWPFSFAARDLLYALFQCGSELDGENPIRKWVQRVCSIF